MPKINSLSPIAAGLLTLCFSLSAQTQAKELLFPSFPASFEKATYQGQQGCIPDDSRALFAVSKNENLKYIGSHSQMTFAKEGSFIMHMVYGDDIGYGYILENRGAGKYCAQQKITNYKKHVNLNAVKTSYQITPEDCTFSPQVLNLCGTLEQVANRLFKAGYKADWQANDQNGNFITMISGTGQSWLLTTNKETGATIFTGAGKGEFKPASN